MISYNFLLDLAIILISTKILGVLTKKIHMPQVVGALIAGLILGPAVFGYIHETEFIKQLAEVGVIVLMFSAGLQTDIKEMKKCGKSAIVVALLGVILPLLGGFGLAAFFNNSGSITQMDTKALLQNIFIGVILTATSVSITVEALQEMGKLNTKAGNLILGAAVIDDILGIIILTVITSTTGTSAQVWLVLVKIILFFILSAVVGFVFYYLFNTYSKNYNPKRRFTLISFSFCLIMSYISEHFFGVADITGAFIAGLVISNTIHAKYISNRFEILSYLFLSPIFFASIGIRTSIGSMSLPIIIFTVLLLLVAVTSKVIGCGLGAYLCKYDRSDSLRVGIGMISRGEVALIIANKGISSGLMKNVFLAPVIIVVVMTTIITPILLKLVYRDRGGGHKGQESEQLTAVKIDNS